MPFPFKKSDDPEATSDAPAFAKKKTGKRRFGKKGGKVAPVQKSMMQSGRSLAGRR